MSESQPLSPQSWSDVYQLLRAKAEASRGTITLTPSDAPSVTFPHTTSRDAFSLALVFDTAVNDHASGHVANRWIWESDLLAGEPEDSTDPYVGNRSLWDTLPVIATELDRVQAPLPDQSLIDDAIGEMETPRPTVADEIRNGATTMLVTVFTESTWRAMAQRQLEFFCRLRGELPGNPFVPSIPATGNADVLSLADYWTDQLARIGARASDTYHRMVYSCWREVMHRVQRHARHAPANETYIHNSELWTALMLLATQSDACNASPAPWAFRVPSCAPPHGHHHHHHPRNAAAVDTGATLDFPAAKTWDEAAQMQRDAFGKLRGEDAITGRLIGRVPRTTVTDVRQLAAFWSAGLAKVGEHSFADISYRHVIDRWKAAVAEVDRLPLTTDPTSVYAHNVDFWEALMTIAIQVAVTAEAPTRWQLVKEATKQAIVDLPSTLKTAAQDLVSNVLARPLLYAGIGVAGLAVVLLLARGSSHTESRP
jgi:hypothetical protein